MNITIIGFSQVVNIKYVATIVNSQWIYQLIRLSIRCISIAGFNTAESIKTDSN